MNVTSDLSLHARRPFRIMPWWVVLIGMAVIVIATVVTLRWLLPIAGRNPALRIDAIRTGLSVGAGAGGATALLLALRRQWLYERAQAHTEEVARASQAHAQDVARQDNLDATERRVTDLYCRAVEQVGHTAAAVRLGGLYSLERLAENHPEHRQTVVNVVCAYLCMVPAQEADPRSDEERQVRLTAQRMLTRHLTHRAAVAGSSGDHEHATGFWGPLRVDLNGAALCGFDFSGCQIEGADFRDAEFFGAAQFQAAQFAGSAQFDNAKFNDGSSFSAAQFHRETSFSDATFEGNVTFVGVRFEGEARFDDTMFNGEAHFTGVAFKGSGRFGDARFRRNAWFDAANFQETAWFGGTQFARGCTFEGAEFAYRDCRSCWPTGWHLQPKTDAIGTLEQDNPALLRSSR
jgi:uncharacterized protein YjbI with pentapeptide repeats